MGHCPNRGQSVCSRPPPLPVGITMQGPGQSKKTGVWSRMAKALLVFQGHCALASILACILYIILVPSLSQPAVIFCPPIISWDVASTIKNTEEG